jgi:type II secretion system protein N
MITRLLSSPWAWRVARWLGYPLFYGMMMVLCVRCTFPYDRLGERVVASFNAAEAKKSGRRIEVDSVRGNWFFGIGAHGVRVISPPSAPAEDGKVLPERVVEWEYARASVSPLRLLLGTLAVGFAGNAGDGSLHGNFRSSQKERSLSLEFEQFGIQDLPLLADTIGMPVLGAVTGKLELAFPEQRLSLGDGKISIVVEDVTLGDGKSKIRDFVALPPLRAGQLTLEVEVTEGRAKITRLDAKGPDLELSVRGQIRLRDTFERSTADLTLEYKFSEQYKTKNEMTKGLFGDPASKITGLLDLDPKVQRAKGADGAYTWRVSGTMAHLSFQPGSPGSDAKGGRSRKSQVADEPSEEAEE